MAIAEDNILASTAADSTDITLYAFYCTGCAHLEEHVDVVDSAYLEERWRSHCSRRWILSWTSCWISNVLYTSAPAWQEVITTVSVVTHVGSAVRKDSHKASIGARTTIITSRNISPRYQRQVHQNNVVRGYCTVLVDVAFVPPAVCSVVLYYRFM